MTTTPTQLPVPSEKPQDLKFNAGKIDEFVTSMGWTYTDRFGSKHYTIEGINHLAQEVMSAFGYVTLTGLTFTTGATVNQNEVLFNTADNSYYKWSGSFVSGPKVVPENSTPETTGGIGPGKWLSVGDTVLRNDLKSESGTDNVNGTKNFNNAVERKLTDILSERISILDFGGKDDGVGNTGTTNNFNPIKNAFDHIKNNGGILHFPRTETGIYYINGSDLSVTDATGLEIEIDNGVSFVLVGDYTPLIVKGLKVNRELSVKILPTNYTFRQGPKQYRRQSEVMPSMSQRNGTYEVPVSLGATDFTGYQLSNSLRATLALTGDDVSLTIPFTNVTDRNVAVVKCENGDEVGAINSSETGSVTIGVVTMVGFCVIEQVLATNDITLSTSGISTGISKPVSQVSRDQFNSALLSVRVISEQLFSVCVNGIPLGTFDAGYPITGVAIGGVGRTTGMSWSSMYKIKNGNVSGARPLRILALGDSTSDPAIPCSQYDYMSQYLASAGCQLYELNNIAKSGETSTQQLSRFNDIGISGYDFCIANIGINDIQTGVSPSTYAANVKSMAVRCKSQGVKFILSLPTLWYSKTEAAVHGQGGQDTTNNQNGSQYRALAIRAVAGEGGLISTGPIRHEGQISADLLGVAGLDPVLADNIHPTAYGRMMMGLGNAMAIMGAINPYGYRSKKLVTLPDRYLTGNKDPSGATPSGIIENGEITLVGTVAVISGYVAGQPVIRLDNELSSGYYSYLSVPALNHTGVIGTATMVCDGTGNISFLNLPLGTTTLSVDGVKVKKY